MVRQRPRKSVEELYSTKFEANPLKSQVNPANNANNAHISHNSHTTGTTNSVGTAKTSRGDRDYGYIISSTTPYGTGDRNTTATSGMATSRRRTARPSHPAHAPHAPAHNAHAAHAAHTTHTAKAGKEEKNASVDDGKKDHGQKPKTSRAEKCSFATPVTAYENTNKVCAGHSEGGKEMHQGHQAHQGAHHHHAHPPSHDDDKDDDTEEFFELIRHTVENAIGKSISDLLNRNFRELSSKVDRFSSELKATNQLLGKLQLDMNNKVIHYGEENSRHFRYLCMKSEYDKMFYQHHTMLAATPTGPANSSVSSPAVAVPPMPPTTAAATATATAAAAAAAAAIAAAAASSRPSTSAAAAAVAAACNASEKRACMAKGDCDKAHNPCTCRNTVSKAPSSSVEPQKSSSEERSVSPKSSEMGMREVLEHIQRFCTQMQLNDLKCDDQIPKTGTFRLDDSTKINKAVFEEDDDDFQMSSDGMTPRSDENVGHKYGGATMRSCGTTRCNNGGGDA